MALDVSYPVGMQPCAKPKIYFPLGWACYLKMDVLKSLCTRYQESFIYHHDSAMIVQKMEEIII